MNGTRAATSRGMDKVYHVRWVSSGWRVCDEHATVSEPRYSQADAVMHAKELARRDGSAQIVVHDELGTVVSEFFYQREERKALDYDDAPPSLAATHADKRTG